MTPHAEPSSLPPLFNDWQEWRETYSAYVEDFKASPGNASDRVMLEIRLKRLGFVGCNLYNELTHICTQPRQ